MADTVAHQHAAAPPDGPHVGPPRVPDFEIIPRRGLVLVAVAIAGLIAAIVSNSLWALTFFHVASGALWTGVDLFVGLIVGPILGRLPVPARIEFSVRFMPKMLLLMPTLVALTLGAGYQLARAVGNLDPSSPNHAWVVASFVVVGVLTVIAIGLLEPANLAVLFELKKPRPDGERIGRLMKVFLYTVGATGLMQLATLVIMTYLASHD